MPHVTSADGTRIVYERSGSGPPVILVTGNLDDGAENAPLARELAADFSAYNYNRRGRGESGDTPPYALAREIDDIAALVYEAGGTAHVYGTSSGGALALEAAAAGLPIRRLAVYDVPYSVGDDALQRWREYVERLGPALAAGLRDEALELFMRLAGSPEDMIAGARTSPMWPALEEIAPTLAYDAACLGDGRPPTARLEAIAQPTLVATAGAQPDAAMSGLPADFFARAADAIVASVPHAERLTLEGQSHVPDPKVLGPVLKRFFENANGPPEGGPF